MATKMYTYSRVLGLIGPAKSYCISWLASDKNSSFFSVLGICVLRFLPAAMQLGQSPDTSPAT